MNSETSIIALVERPAPAKAIAHCQPRNLKRLKGFLLPVCGLLMSMLTVGMMTGSNPTLALTSAWVDALSVRRAADQVQAHAMIKGYSRAEELGSITCPDTDRDGFPNACATSDGAIGTGDLPTNVRVASGQLALAPGHGAAVPRRLQLAVNPQVSGGNDNTRSPVSDAIAWTLAIDRPSAMSSSSGGPANISAATGSMSDNDVTLTLAPYVTENAPSNIYLTSLSAHASQSTQRLGAAFMAHLQRSARNSNQSLGQQWAFDETLHLAYLPDSAGSRFVPVNSGCQCTCTRTRCKCNCLQASYWQSRGACQNAADAGVCTTANISPWGRITQCLAAAGRFCYLQGESWLANRWAVSLYAPRATEGRSCRPERNDTCPLTTRTGTTCTCDFDWPKPLSADRLNRIRLQFTDGKPRVIVLP